MDDPFASILDVSIANKIPHLHECGGSGRCTTCRIRIIDGFRNLSPMTQREKDTARRRNWDPSLRLACQTRTRGDVAIQRLVWTSAEISSLQKEMVPLGKGEERPLGILFCDMRNFTRIAEDHSNFDLAHMLNRFFTILGDPILMNNGIIYQYAGDEIIGLFGTGGGEKDQICMDAIRAGLGMIYAAERLNKMELKEFGTEFRVGIGIHYGQAFVGHIGHPKHKQFAVIGDPVNVASRIESQNKEMDTSLLVSNDFLWNFPEGTFKLGKEDVVLLKGKEQPVVVHEILNFIEPDTHLEVQATLDLILKNEEQFAAKFYEKVFTKAPPIKELFKRNMVDQGRMLTHMLGGIIYSLSRPEYLALGLQALGQQHEGYGVKSDHYPVVRETLLETIAEELGEIYTPKVQKAWETALDLVVDGMQAHGR